MKKNFFKALKTLIASASLVALASCGNILSDNSNSSSVSNGEKAKVTFNISSSAAKTILPDDVDLTSYYYMVSAVDTTASLAESTDLLTERTQVSGDSLSLSAEIEAGTYNFTVTAYDAATSGNAVLTGTTENVTISSSSQTVSIKLYAAAGGTGTVSVTLKVADALSVSTVKAALYDSIPSADSGASLGTADTTTNSGYSTFTYTNDSVASGESKYLVFYLYDSSSNVVTTYAESVYVIRGGTSSKVITIDTATFTVTVTVQKDGTDWTDSGLELSLVDANDSEIEMTPSTGTALYTANVTDGTYTVCVGQNSKGITVDTDNTSVTLDYDSDAVFPNMDATSAYADTYFEITFDNAPTIDRAAEGTVRIYTTDGTLVDTIKPAAETMYGYGYGGNSGLGSINVQYQLIQMVDTNKVRIIPHHNTSTGYTLLSNSTGYYIVIDDGIISGTLTGRSFTGVAAGEWAFTTGAAPTVSGSTLTVGTDKNFITVQGAMSWLMSNSKTGDWTVNIDAGTYYERVFYNGSANLILSGQGSATYGTDVEIQWCNQDGDSGTTLWNTGARGRNVFYYAGKDLTLENISFINTATRYTNEYGEYDSTASDTANGKNQAETLMFDSTGNCAAYNCNFKSKQDTIYLSPSGGKAWFYGCKISGDIDFIWGLSDVALIERCNIISTYDARATNTYILAPHLSNSSAPYGKGFVLYNSTVTTESGQTTYLARSPWGSSGNISQVAVIDTAVTGGLASNPWYGSHVGSSDETILGWKYYNVTSDETAISVGNAISDFQYAAEFAGRNNIINRTYDGSAFSKAASTWDVNTLASDRNWSVVEDSSKATLDGETETTSVTWDTSSASLSQTRNTTFYMYTDLTTTTTTPSGDDLYNYLYCDGSANDYIQGSLELYGTAAIYVPVTTSSTATITFTKGAGTLTIAGTDYTASDSATVDCSSATLVTLNGINYVEVRVNGTAGGTSDKYYITNVTVVTAGESSGGSSEENEDVTEDSWTLTSRTDSPFSSFSSSSSTTLSSDATVAGTNSVLTLTLSAAGTDVGETQGTPGYKYNSSNGLCIKRDCLKIAGITGDVTLTITGNNGGSSERNLEVTIGSSGTVNTQAVSSGASFTYTKSFTGSDTTVYIGASNELYIGTITIASSSGSSSSSGVSSVTISGTAAMISGGTVTLTATPDTTPDDETYTWAVASGSDYVTLASTTTSSMVVTGTAAGTATITATVDGVTSSAYTITVKDSASDFIVDEGSTITDSDSSSRSSSLTISSSDVPTGYAGVDYSTNYGSTSYNTVTVTTRSDLVYYAKTGGYFIIVDGMIDMTEGMLPSIGGGTTSSLDSFVNTNTSGVYTSYTDWVAAYAAACSLTSDDETAGSGNTTLYSTLWALSNAYKSQIQLVIASNTIIVGKDASSGIKGAVLSMNGVSNVQLRNLTIQDAYDPFPHHESGDGYNAQWDGIVIQGDCSYIWIDHCTIQDTMTVSHVYTSGVTEEKWQTYDGLLDIKGNGQYITVSYCKFKNHDKTSLIGNTDSTETYTNSSGTKVTVTSGYRKITYHHNYFYNCGQRLPMVRYTTMHLYNNLYESSSPYYTQQYAVGVRTGSIIYSEYNYFGSGILYAFSGDTSSSKVGTFYSYGDEAYSTVTLYNSSKGISASNGDTLFSAGPAAYTYTAEDAATVQANLPTEAGPGAVTIN